jgi:hypothetical protein
MSPAEFGPENDCAGEDHSNCKRQTHTLEERMLYKDYDSKCSIEKKIMVVSLKGLGGKTN